MNPDPKPPRRIVASRLDWDRIRAAKCNRCRLCGTQVGITAHHIVPRSLGGDDVSTNIVGLCGSGTTGCHGAIEARDHAALSDLRSKLEHSEIRYCIDKKSMAWLDRYLPERKGA